MIRRTMTNRAPGMLAAFIGMMLLLSASAAFAQNDAAEGKTDEGIKAAKPERTENETVSAGPTGEANAYPKFDAKPAEGPAEFPRAKQTRPVEELRFQVTAYLWLPHVTGRVKPLAAAPTFSINTSIGDLIRDSDGAFMLTGTARKDRFVFLWDFNYSGSSKEGQAVAPIAGGIPVSATAKIRQVSATLMTGTSVYQRQATTVDILGGIRIWRIKADVSATLPPPFNFASGSKAWVDPLAGIRIRQALSPRWSLILYGDAGGFSAG